MTDDKPTEAPRELPLCTHCHNTGVHLCPDINEPVLVGCDNKNCPITELQDDLLRERERAEKAEHLLENVTENRDMWANKAGAYMQERDDLKAKLALAIDGLTKIGGQLSWQAEATDGTPISHTYAFSTINVAQKVLRELGVEK